MLFARRAERERERNASHEPKATTSYSFLYFSSHNCVEVDRCYRGCRCSCLFIVNIRMKYTNTRRGTQWQASNGRPTRMSHSRCRRNSEEKNAPIKQLNSNEVSAVLNEYT